jgi:hypothetical protein
LEVVWRIDTRQRDLWERFMAKLINGKDLNKVSWTLLGRTKLQRFLRDRMNKISKWSNVNAWDMNDLHNSWTLNYVQWMNNKNLKWNTTVDFMCTNRRKNQNKDA